MNIESFLTDFCYYFFKKQYYIIIERLIYIVVLVCGFESMKL